MLVRIITALILAPLALGAIYLLDTPAFALVVLGIVALAAYEWAGLVFIRDPEAPPSVLNNPSTAFIGNLMYVSIALALCGWLWVRPDVAPQWLLIAAASWLWAIVEVLIYPRQAQSKRNLRWVMFGLVVLPGAWYAMLTLQQRDPHLLVMVCFLVWGADAGAYFAGKALGRRKLAPQVSPGKTWEGALGGALTGILVALGFGVMMVPAVADRLALDGVSVLLALVALVVLSVFGDLFESILKRTAGAKDSGRLLPGHGGILDRIDALIAVLPVAALLAYRL